MHLQLRFRSPGHQLHVLANYGRKLLDVRLFNRRNQNAQGTGLHFLLRYRITGAIFGVLIGGKITACLGGYNNVKAFYVMCLEGLLCWSLVIHLKLR